MIFRYFRPLETRLDHWLFFDHLSSHRRYSLCQLPSLGLHPQVSFQSILSFHYSKPIQLLEASLPSWYLYLFEVHLLIVLEGKGAPTQSSIESLDDSLVPVNVYIPSSCPHITLCHFSCDTNHEFTPRIKLNNFWPSQWSTLIDCLKSLWDLREILRHERLSSLESACNINNCQCVLVDFLTFRKPVMRKEKKISLMNCIWRFNIRCWSWDMLRGSQEIREMACLISQSVLGYFSFLSQRLYSWQSLSKASSGCSRFLNVFFPFYFVFTRND